MKKNIILILIMILALPLLCFAHSGRTDANGGHWDRSTGIYHYHHGYPAHQHTNGVCPYAEELQLEAETTSENNLTSDSGTVKFIPKKIIESQKERTGEETMSNIILYALLSVIAVCLIAVVYYLNKLSSKQEPEQTEEPKTPDTPHPLHPIGSDAIPDDVAFDNKNLPYRISRSSKKKNSYGRDFNAYLVKGGRLYHKQGCDEIKGKKIVTRHIYECIADKNKKPCKKCKPRTQVHEWYKKRFPDAVYAKASLKQEIQEESKVSLFDVNIETVNTEDSRYTTICRQVPRN